MNAFYEHHKDNITLHYHCFDRILLFGESGSDGDKPCRKLQPNSVTMITRTGVPQWDPSGRLSGRATYRK